MTSTLLVNVAAVEVCILSVEATPINPDPSPTNDVAVATPVITTPCGFACAFISLPLLSEDASIPVKLPPSP